MNHLLNEGFLNDFLKNGKSQKEWKKKSFHFTQKISLPCNNVYACWFFFGSSSLCFFI